MMNVKHSAQCFTYNKRSKFTASNIAQKTQIMNLILNWRTYQTSISESFFAPFRWSVSMCVVFKKYFPMKVPKDRQLGLPHIRWVGVYICATRIAEICGDEKKLRTGLTLAKSECLLEKGRMYSFNKYLMPVKHCYNFWKKWKTNGSYKANHAELLINTLVFWQ